MRRIALILPAVAATGFVAAGPALALGRNGWEGPAGGGHAEIEGGWAGGEYRNLGGPYGITCIKGEKAHSAAERGYFVRCPRQPGAPGRSCSGTGEGPRHHDGAGPHACDPVPEGRQGSVRHRGTP